VERGHVARRQPISRSASRPVLIGEFTIHASVHGKAPSQARPEAPLGVSPSHYQESIQLSSA
jgi:hypothetical protein